MVSPIILCIDIFMGCAVVCLSVLDIQCNLYGMFRYEILLINMALQSWVVFVPADVALWLPSGDSRSKKCFSICIFLILSR